MPHTSSQRPALGIMFVLMSCSSLQFGAAFAVTLFPLFGALAVSVCRHHFRYDFRSDERLLLLRD